MKVEDAEKIIATIIEEAIEEAYFSKRFDCIELEQIEKQKIIDFWKGRIGAKNCPICQKPLYCEICGKDLTDGEMKPYICDSEDNTHKHVECVKHGSS